MKKYLNNLPKDIRDLVHLAGEVAGETEVYAYLVGGIVRDLILGVPNFDLDIVIQGDGLMFASCFARRLNARLMIHHRFGTATLITPKKIKLDIATCRSEVYPKPASLPVVFPGTIREDLARRDFSINTLAIDLLPKNFGNLVDFYQGRQDLKAGVIRVLHNSSFIDDPTRIIRAVRFEQRFKFRIEPHSLRLLKQAKGMGMLRCVSPHRLRDEIILILKEPLAIRCILRLEKLAGLDFIHRQLKLNKANLEYLTAIKNEISWYNKNFPKRRALDSWLLYFIGLLSNLNRNQIKQVCRIFGLRRGEIKRAVSYSKFSSRKVLRLSKKNIRPSQIYRDLEPLSFEVILLIKARYKNKFLNRNIQKFFKHYNGTRLYIRGEDLIRLGMSPGPDYQKIFNRLLYLQLDGRIHSRQEALEWISRLHPLTRK
jgi:tRNA nucleotidyltransferase (CCA-adding enzyme)